MREAAVQVRYTRWTGQTPVNLTADRLFEALCAQLTTTDDLDEALERVAREGVSLDGLELVGVDDLLAAIRERLRELSKACNFDAAFAEHRALLERLLARERDAIEGDEDELRRERRRTFVSRLPADFRGRMDRLAHYDFADVEARDAFDGLLDGRDDVDRIADFVQRHGGSFRGPRAVTFEEALDIVAEIERLKRIEDLLFHRDFVSIDLDEIEALLGKPASRGIAGMREMVSTLASAGLITRRAGQLVLSPRGAQRLGELALREIHSRLAFDGPGLHAVLRRGHSDPDPSGTRDYRFGEPCELAPVASVTNAVRRCGVGPLRLVPEDLAVWEATRGTRSATVLLLDMSWSMSWEGRFAAAKKVALAMQTLMRTRFPRDYFAVVGFFTRAVKIEPNELHAATWNPEDPFTNLQDALRLGASLLDRDRGTNKDLLVVTDGQPTAYFDSGRLFCEWPMNLGGLSTRATIETLREVERVTKRGIRINTFMLDDSPPLRGFVDKMTAINRGRAFYTTPADLGRCLLVDHVARRRRLIHSR